MIDRIRQFVSRFSLLLMVIFLGATIAATYINYWVALLFYVAFGIATWFFVYSNKKGEEDD